MPLETGTYISDLVVTNPAATDGLAQADDHLRLIKSALKNTFASFTGAALSSTQAQLDAAVAAVNTNGIAVLADTGAFFKTHTTDGVTNPASGEVDVKAGGVAALKVKSDGSVTASGVLTGATVTGPGATPIGASFVWWSDTLPSGFGTFAFLNGQAVSRSTYAALFTSLGTTYGVGDGSTTFNLPDLRDNVPVGKGTMGGTSAVGRITQYTTSVLGTLIGAALHVLSLGELPAHTHTASVTDPGHTHLSGFLTGGAGVNVNAIPMNYPGSSGNTTSSSSTTGISVTNSSVGSGTAHDNVPPGIICNWIMRIA